MECEFLIVDFLHEVQAVDTSKFQIFQILKIKR